MGDWKKHTRDEGGIVRFWRPAVASLFMLMWLSFFTSLATAGPPTHPRSPSLDLIGAPPDPGAVHPSQPFNHACGTAVDSKGDVYVASAGTGTIDVFNSAHEYLRTIIDSNEPCGLAVNSKGELFVSEKGNVVRFKPNAYPFAGIPTYGPAEPIDSSSEAKGISVDRFDDRLYIAKGNAISVYKADGTAEPASNEVQRVRIIDSTGGSYTLSFRGKTTKELPYNASCGEMQSALTELATIGLGNVVVVEEPSGDVRRCIVTFEATLHNKTVPQLRCDSLKLTGGAFNCNATTLSQGFSGSIEGGLTKATGVAAYTHKVSGTTTDRYVFAADDGVTDEVKIFRGPEISQIEVRKAVKGVDQDRNPETPDQSFGFGPAGTYLAVDPGNRNAEDKCGSIAEQACTAGHFLVYDDAHEAVDELEASGEFLDQFTNDAFADGEPTAIAVERSGSANDGAIYVTAGPGAGAKLLAFGPLAAPSRDPLDPPLSQKEVPQARAVTTDPLGNVYVAAGPLIHVYGPTGVEIKVGPEGKGIEDPQVPLRDLAVDSSGKVYVLERTNPDKVTYYTPVTYPPVDGTSYVRHEPSIAVEGEFAKQGGLKALAINPGPAPGKDRLLVTSSSSTLEYDSAASGSKSLRCVACGIELGNRESIAVNGANGNVYFGTTKVSIINPEGTEVLAGIAGGGCPEGPLSGNVKVAVDQSNGHFVVFSINLGRAREYDASGACVAEFGQFAKLTATFTRVAIDNSCALHEPPLTEATIPTCNAVYPSSGNVYIAFDDPGNTTNPFDLTAFGPLTYGAAPLTVTGVPAKVSGGSATLNGTVDPNGFDLTECKFEYLLNTQYVSNGKTFAGAFSKDCAETLGAVGKGDDPFPVHVDLTGLDPDARYRFRLVAANKYGESIGKAGLFGPPLVTTQPALPVLYHEATLRAEVDPSGLTTEYHFEYGPDEGYGQSTPVDELSPGEEAVLAQAVLASLEEGTKYHFRVVAKNEAKTIKGPDQTFKTQERPDKTVCLNDEFRTGLSTGLPDCRAYELVTPAETNGLSPIAASFGTAGTTINNWLVVPRGPGAGESLSYFTFGTLPGFDGNGRLDGYRAERGEGAHPSQGWSGELFGPSFEEAAPGSLHLPGQQGVAADQRYSFWFMEPEEAFEGTLPEGIYLRSPFGFEALAQGSLGSDLKAKSWFVSAGGAHAIFSSREHLEPAAAPSGTEAIYDRTSAASTATVVSVDPNGDPFAVGEDAAYVASTEDGSAIVFKVGSVLYLHREGQTKEIAGAANTFAGISEDGRRVFYAGASFGGTPATIFVCDVQAGPCGGTGAHPPTQLALNSLFISVSPDGSHALFASKEAISGVEANENGETAETGEWNLYAWDAQTETTSFVAQLVSEDFDGFGENPEQDLGSWTKAIGAGPAIGRAKAPTRSTPNGGIFLFQSHAQLTSYDNHGRGEIYRYDPAGEVGERLLCISCDPSGAPPTVDAVLQDTAHAVTGVIDQTLIPNVTDDGEEVFFQSKDRLLPEDANDVQDVYEWKAKDAGGCKRPEGCLALISSGQGDQPSYLYSMSADGDNIFFRTQEKLIGTDVLGSPSIYDARVEGGIPDPPVDEPCDGDACQGAGSPPPALSAPASTSAGDGDVVERKPPCPKGKHRVKNRCVKKHHRKHHRKHQRANHSREARP